MRAASYARSLLAVAVCAGCSNRLELGSDLLWSADTESADLSQWLQGGAVQLPSEEASVQVTSEQRRSGRHALELVNPAAWQNEEAGPELWHGVGPQADAYYSAWFMLPEDYRLEPSLTLMHLRSREADTEAPLNGEQLQLRSLPGGGFVLVVFNNNAGFLLEPVAEPAPYVTAGRWFQLEARYEPQSAGRLRVWLDGELAYDLPGRPGAAGSEQVLSVASVVERSVPAPLRLFVDDAAVSASRVGANGHLAFD